MLFQTENVKDWPQVNPSRFLFETTWKFTEHSSNNVQFTQRMRDPKLMKNTFINAGFLFLCIIYTLVTETALDLLSCTKQNDGSYSLNAQPCTHGNLLLLSILALQCYDAQWKSMMPVMVLALLGYTLGLPAIYVLIVSEYIVLKLLDHLLKNKNKIFTRDREFGDRFGAMFAIYRPKWNWWELLNFGKKLGMVIAKVWKKFNPFIEGKAKLFLQ